MTAAQSRARAFIQHFSTYAIGNISRQFIGFLMLPIYTRYLSPAEYGIVGLMMFAISLTEGLLGARLGPAIPKYYFQQDNDLDAKRVVSTAILATGGVSIFLVLLLAIGRHPASQLLFGSDQYAAITAMFSVLLLTNALEGQCLVYLQLRRQSGLYVSFNLIKLAMQFALNMIFVVYLEMGVKGIAIASTISATVFAAGLSCYVFAQTGFRFKSDLAWRMVTFSWPLWLAGVASMYIGSSSRYYIRLFESLDSVGLYELGARFGSILGLLVAQPFSRYWETERFSYYRDSNSSSLFRNVFVCYSGLLLLAALGISIFSLPTIRIMASPAYYGAAAVVPLLAVSTMLRCMMDFCSFGFMVSERTGWLTGTNYFGAALVTVLYLCLIPLLGFIGAGVSLVLAEAAQLVLVERLSRRYFNMNINYVPLLWMFVVGVGGYLIGSALPTATGVVIELAYRCVVYLVTAVAIVVVYLRTNPGQPAFTSLLPQRLRELMFRISATQP